MTNLDNINPNAVKALFKEALVEVIEENQELVSSILVDALEDIALSRAIEERTTCVLALCPHLGEKSKTVSRDEVFQVLSGE